MWDIKDAAWEEGFGYLTVYVQANGSAHVPTSYRAGDGYRLGQWVGVQRRNRNSMSADCRRRLEALNGWKWNTLAAAWEEGFGHLTGYVQANGSASVPANYRTAEGYRLGRWVITQRTKKDALSLDRRQRLEAMPGWVWDTNTAAWEEGFEALTAYVQAEGHARVPQRCRTAKGYPLGQWVGVQRGTKETMSADRCERLEAVKGWVWLTRARPSTKKP